MSSGAPNNPLPSDSALVIATTNNVVFLYFPERTETRVVPLDNISSLKSVRSLSARERALVPATGKVPVR
jgi:hypothetical protein